MPDTDGLPDSPSAKDGKLRKRESVQQQLQVGTEANLLSGCALNALGCDGQYCTVRIS